MLSRIAKKKNAMWKQKLLDVFYYVALCIKEII